MGAIFSFCSDAEESEKSKILGEAPPSEQSDSALEQQEQDEDHALESQHASMDSNNSNKDEAERALREEQARLELIVSTAGRDMVAVRSTREALLLLSRNICKNELDHPVLYPILFLFHRRI
jgi:hypothetical protein